MNSKQSVKFGRKSMISTAAIVTLAYAGITHAAVDAYGTEVVDGTNTGNDYECSAGYLDPQGPRPFCSDNPFVSYDSNQSRYTFIDSLGQPKTTGFFDSQIGATAPANYTETSSSGDSFVYEGNIALGTTINARDLNSDFALFKNYAAGVIVTAATGSRVHLHSNNADGASITNDANSTVYLSRNSAIGAQLNNYGTMVVDGNSAENARIETFPGSQTLDIVHSNSDGFLLIVGGGQTNAYDVQANVANITVARDAALLVADCTQEILQCPGTTVRGTTLENGATLTNNGGLVTLSGTIRISESDIRNSPPDPVDSEPGLIRLTNVAIAGGSIENFARLELGAGNVALDVPVTGGEDPSSPGTIATTPNTNVHLREEGLLNNPNLEVNGGQIGFEIDLSVPNAQRLAFGSVTPPMGNPPRQSITPVRLTITAPPNTGSQTTGTGIEVVSVTQGALASADNAFVMSPFTNNGFTYSLARADNGNWYLQSVAAASINATPVPTVGAGLLGLMSLTLAVLGFRRVRTRDALPIKRTPQN